MKGTGASLKHRQLVHTGSTNGVLFRDEQPRDTLGHLCLWMLGILGKATRSFGKPTHLSRGRDLLRLAEKPTRETDTVVFANYADVFVRLQQRSWHNKVENLEYHLNLDALKGKK